MAPIVTLYILGGCVAVAAFLFMVMMVLSALRPPLPDVAFSQPPFEPFQRLPLATRSIELPAVQQRTFDDAPTTHFRHAKGTTPPPVGITPPREVPPIMHASPTVRIIPPREVSPMTHASPTVRITPPREVPPMMHAFGPAFSGPSPAASFGAELQPLAAASRFGAEIQPLPAASPFGAVQASFAAAAHASPFAAPRAVNHPPPFVQIPLPLAPQWKPLAVPQPARLRPSQFNLPRFPERRQRRAARFFILTFVTLFSLSVIAASAIVAYPPMLNPICDDYEWFGAETAQVVRERAQDARDWIGALIHRE